MRIRDQDHEEDKLDDGSECRFEDDACHPGHLARHFLPREAEEIGRGDHGDVVEDEDPEVGVGAGIVLSNGGLAAVEGLLNRGCRAYNCDGGRYEGPQHVEPFRQSASAPETNPDKPERMDAFATTLSVRLNPFCHFVPVVVVLW